MVCNTCDGLLAMTVGNTHSMMVCNTVPVMVCDCTYEVMQSDVYIKIVMAKVKYISLVKKRHNGKKKEANPIFCETELWTQSMENTMYFSSRAKQSKQLFVPVKKF